MYLEELYLVGRQELICQILVEIADFFDVSIPEIIRGERKSATMENDVKKIAESMSDYAATEKLVLLKRVKLASIIGLISIVTGLIMESIHHESNSCI